MLIGVLGFVVVMAGIIWLPISIFTKKRFKKPVFLMAAGFILFIVGVWIKPELFLYTTQI